MFIGTTISIAIADEGRNREVRFFGTVANDGDALARVQARVSARID